MVVPVKYFHETENIKEIWGLVASMMGVLAFGQGLLHSILPLIAALLGLFSKLFRSYSSYCYFDINDGGSNELYNDVQLYLGSTLSNAADASTRLTVTRTFNSSAFTLSLSGNATVIDTYNGVSFQWQHFVPRPRSQSSRQRYDDEPEEAEKRRLTLRFRTRDKSLVLESYLNHITRAAVDISRKNTVRLLYTNSKDRLYDSKCDWRSVPFKHPSTFDTLAMDPDKKEEIMNDLKDFASEGQSFYHKTGRAWKRGYLLYGPPGTGKSSMIAAMANFLNYDIYDLELTEVSTNSALRKLLMKTSSKSIIVIEDIDCSVNLTNRKTDQVEVAEEKGRAGARGSELTLSGLLNFTDGLWSCCGSERIFVFTTNHVEKLDPALLRSGRMDMHILMSYCSFESLKILLRNYLEYTKDDLSTQVWDELERVVEKVRMTPADVSEHLIKHRRDKAKAVQELIMAMKLKAEANGTEPESEKEQDMPASGPEEEKTLL